MKITTEIDKLAEITSSDSSDAYCSDHFEANGVL